MTDRIEIHLAETAIGTKVLLPDGRNIIMELAATSINICALPGQPTTAMIESIAPRAVLAKLLPEQVQVVASHASWCDGYAAACKDLLGEIAQEVEDEDALTFDADQIKAIVKRLEDGLSRIEDTSSPDKAQDGDA